MTEDGRYTAKEVDEKLNALAKRMEKRIAQVIVVSRNNQFPEDSNPTSLLMSVEDRTITQKQEVVIPKPPKREEDEETTDTPTSPEVDT